MGFYGLLWASVDGGTEGQTDDRTEGGTDRQMELVLDWKRVRMVGCRIGRVLDWKSVGLEECRIGRV